MSKRTRKRSPHNQGRKPFYKEHRFFLIEEDAVGAATETADEILSHPRYFNAIPLARNLTWGEGDLVRLRTLVESNADIERAAQSLGRLPKSLAWRARDAGLHLPASWSALITPPRKPIVRANESLLCYPYVAKARPGNTDLLRANALIPHGMPEHIRADIVQEVMLAMYEGRIELADLEKNRTKVRWFIAKFYKEQMPREEVSLDGAVDDSRSYDEIASSMWHEHREAERNDARHTRDSYATHTAPTQVEDIYQTEVSAAHSRLYSRSVYVSRTEAADALDSGEFKWSDDARGHWTTEALLHSMDRVSQRYGIEFTRSDLTNVRRFCHTHIPRQNRADGEELHFVRLRGVTLICIYDRDTTHLRTFLPPDSMNRDGSLSDAGREFYYSTTNPEYRRGRLNDQSRDRIRSLTLA